MCCGNASKSDLHVMKVFLVVALGHEQNGIEENRIE